MERHSPNIFCYATGELSQDAFICWLLEWADKKYSDVDVSLHDSGLTLLNALLGLHDQMPVEQPNIVVSKQVNNVDIVVEINGQFILMIEDKVHSREHLAQLTYSKAIRKKFPKHKILPIFFKTGDQCDYSKVEAVGYRCFLRRDLLRILTAGVDAGVANPIFVDFRDYLWNIETTVESFRTLRVSEWSRHHNCWIGFFKELKFVFPDLNWARVNNPSGGFWSADWTHLKWKRHRVYLQMEEDKLCFKIDATRVDAGKSEIRNRWMKKVLDTGTKFGITTVKRPERLGVGNWMTVAQISKENWLMADTDGFLDVRGTIRRLKKAEKLLHKAVAA